MTTKIFMNLPIPDLNKSIEFFTELVFKFNRRFTDKTATCMVVTDHVFVMLLTHAKKCLRLEKFVMQRKARRC